MWMWGRLWKFPEVPAETNQIKIKRALVRRLSGNDSRGKMAVMFHMLENEGCEGLTYGRCYAERQGEGRTGPGRCARMLRRPGRSAASAVYVLGTHLWTDVWRPLPGSRPSAWSNRSACGVEVVRDGQAEEVATNGKQRWPLSPSTTLRSPWARRALGLGTRSPSATMRRRGSRPSTRLGSSPSHWVLTLSPWRDISLAATSSRYLGSVGQSKGPSLPHQISKPNDFEGWPKRKKGINKAIYHQLSPSYI